MTDRSTRQAQADTAGHANEQPGFTRRIARKFGLTLAQAQALILVVGTDIAKLTEAAERMRKRAN